MTKKQKRNACEYLYILTYSLENGKVEIGKDIDISWIEGAKRLANEIDEELKKGGK